MNGEIPEDKIVMVGNCPKCKKQFIRPFPCDTAACQCTNQPMEVPLEPHMKITLRMRDGRKLREIISRSRIPITILPKRGE